MTSTKEILKARIKKKINELQKEGITGMSKANMKQFVPTTGLICSVSEYHKAFDEACESFDSFLYD